MKALLTYCERELPWLLEAIETLVRIESPSTDHAALDRCARALAAQLADLGGRVRRLPPGAAGGHLRAEFGTGGRQVLLLGHFDTVWDVGTLAARPVRRSRGRLYGPGVFDMKAGLGIGMLAVRALADGPEGLPGRVVLLLTSDEETGSATSRAIVEEEARRSAAVLVLEPSLPGGALKTGRKGCGEYILRVTGVAAHAGIDPEKGANAVHELARQILAVESVQDPGRGTTLSVNVVRGGSRTNVVADAAEAIVDVRVSVMSEAARVEEAMAALRVHDARTRLAVTGGVDRPPFERTPDVAALATLARTVAAELGRDLGEGATGGGSDGNFTAALGVPTLDGLGAVGDGAHAAGEHICIADLPWRAALVAGVLRRILAG